MIKRAFDVVVSATLLVIFAPIMLITAVAILISMGRPIFFYQQRPGYFGKPFTLMKFRSMAQTLDKAGQPLSDGDRLTALGKHVLLAEPR